MSRRDKPIIIRGVKFSEWRPCGVAFERAEGDGTSQKIKLIPLTNSGGRDFLLITYGMLFLWESGPFKIDRLSFSTIEEAQDHVDDLLDLLERFGKLEAFQ